MITRNRVQAEGMIEFYTLSNGIRIIHTPVKGRVAYCGFMVNTGSRDELENEQGLAHFIEHVVFKGTKRRKAYHILSRLENVGGDLNAYTTKEDTCIYASFLPEQYQRTLELFSDIISNSVFPEKELVKEKEVIIDEINSYKDSPSEQIFDDFEELLFQGHPLGRPILGTPEHLKNFSRKHVLRFMARNYKTHQMVVSSVGDIRGDKLVRLCEKYFGSIAAEGDVPPRLVPAAAKGSTTELSKAHYQAHCVIGATAYSATHENRSGLLLLNNLLGGPGMNTRLNMNIREKYGFCYNLDSSYQPYSDSGVFCIYLGTDFEYLEKTIALVLNELKKLRENSLGSLQLYRAKQQIKGQIAIAFESNLNEMLSMGKSYLVHNKVESIEEIFARIDSLSALSLVEIANEVFNPDYFTTLIYKR
jgi:predicted Zn-dependent peptidase